MNLLEVTGLCKRFGFTQALDRVDLTLRAGTVEALIGENGAGKSTLIRILSGAERADAGSIRWNGKLVRFASPAEATAAGIAVLHQEPPVVDALSALENLFIGRKAFARGPFGRVSRRALDATARRLFAEYAFELPLNVAAATLSPAQRTLLGLARCLLDEPRLLILDEPTTSLTSTDVTWLATVLRRLAARGSAVLFVSHRLNEVLALCEHVTAMRNGRVTAAAATVTQDRDGLIAMMAGVAPAPTSAPTAAPAFAEPPLLQIAALTTVDGKVVDLSLTARAGEIVGVYGLAGAGRTELLEAAFGARARRAGTVSVAGRDVEASPAASLRAGVCLVPEDRKRSALVARLSVGENIALPFVARFATCGVIRRRRERSAARDAVDAFAIKTAGIDQRVGELSGGNQQKVVFARMWGLRPRVLLCDEPTQGVDVATRRNIHALLRRHVAGGGTAVVVTSDLDELMSLADRIVVLREGRVSDSFERAFVAGDVLQACFQPAAPAAAETVADAR